MTDEVKHTPGPWWHQEKSDAYTHIVRAGENRFICQLPQDTSGRAEADARLIAAAPTLADALKGMIGLCQLVRNRGDLPTDARDALTYNHRIIAAYEALSAAGIDGFQPSDFDAAKAKEPRPGAVEALARAFDREDAAQRGEPDPWLDGADDAEWVSERLACAQVAADAYRSALIPPSREPVAEFAKAILHGDDEHRAWLTEAATAFIAGEPLPPPRGKGTAPAPQAVAPTGEDRAETISENPKSLAAWKREADSWRRVAERLESEKQTADATVSDLHRKLKEANAEIEAMTPKFVAYEYLESPAGREIAEARVTVLEKALAEARDHINRYADTAVEHDLIARIGALIGGGGNG